MRALKSNLPSAAAAAVVLLLPFSQPDARAFDIFAGLHWCHCDVSAVHLDGNTSLFVPQVWLPTTTSSPRFMRAWWEKSDVRAPADGWLVWSANYGPFVYALIQESSDVSGADILEVGLTVVDSLGHANGFACSTAHGVIPRESPAQWTFVSVAVDANSGQCDYYVQQGGNVDAGEMINGGPPVSGAAPWGQITGWWIGGDINMNLQPVMDTAEAFLDLTTQYNHNAFVDGTTAFQFATPNGLARNLDNLFSVAPLIPNTHNCAGPTAGIIPAMCNRGGAHAFADGPEVAPGLNAYLMQVIGTLTTATSDPCLFPSPAGDGCDGP